MFQSLDFVVLGCFLLTVETIPGKDIYHTHNSVLYPRRVVTNFFPAGIFSALPASSLRNGVSQQ